MKKLLSNLTIIPLAICFSANLPAQTAGTLTFTYTPVSHNGYSGTKNVLAIWIQTNADGFVKTKIRNVGSSTNDHLPTWTCNSGGYCGTYSFLCDALASTCNTTDATTGATLSSFTTKTITWDGKNVSGTANGTIVADGIYKVTIQSTWNHGTSGTVTKSYTFTKGPNADHQTPANDANFTNIILDWVPAMTTGIDSVSEDPGISVYPNPTNGIFNVDFKKASSIKVVNNLGATVYEEKIENATKGTKSIDLTKYANGIYFIYVSDGEKSSKHKVILNK